MRVQVHIFVSQLQLVTWPSDYNYNLLIISVKFVISYKTVIFQHIALGSSTYTCYVGYGIPVPGLPIQFLVLHRKDMHSSMVTGDTQARGVVVEIYTVNNIMSLYNKPSNQEQSIVKRIHKKHTLVNIWVLSFCTYTLLTASCHCWKHLWKPNLLIPPSLLFSTDATPVVAFCSISPWTQNSVPWANFQSTEQPHIARRR